MNCHSHSQISCVSALRGVLERVGDALNGVLGFRASLFAFGLGHVGLSLSLERFVIGGLAGSGFRLALEFFGLVGVLVAQ